MHELHRNLLIILKNLNKVMFSINVLILLVLYSMQGLTTEKCLKNHESFTCLTTGLFDDPNDSTCRKYYICSLKKHRKLRKSHKHCSKGEKFDPILKECTSEYNCPCSDSENRRDNHSRRENDGFDHDERNHNRHRRDHKTKFVCETEGFFPDPNDNSCSNYYICLKAYGGFQQGKHSCSRGTYFNPYLQECDSNYQCYQDSSRGSNEFTIPDQCRIDKDRVFECEEKGRFAKPNDLSCTKYFLCSKLRSGSFIQTEYTCPTGSYFDSDLKSCNVNFQCPCLKTTPISFTPTIKKPTTISDCQINDDSIFKCRQKGRFRKPNDLTCTKYFLCSLLRNGSFIETEYVCPDGSYFDINRQKCNIKYQCPCVIPISSTLQWSSSETPKTSLNDTSHWITTGNTTTVLNNYTSIFSTEPTTTVIDECKIKENAIFKCIQKGRFKKLNDLSCTKYFLCSVLRNGSFIQTEYTCPDGSYFDESREGCNVNYQCPCTTIPSSLTPHWTTISESIATDFPESTTRTWTSNSITSNPCRTDNSVNFRCTQKGRFRKPNDLTCTQYYLCSSLRNGSIIQTEYSCPDGSYFDTNLQSCNIEFQCPCIIPSTVSPRWISISTDTSEITATTTVPFTTTLIISTISDDCLINNDITFKCSRKGRFKKLNDLTCTKYYLCSILKNGSLIETEYTCPDGSYFDDSRQRCNVNYQCPCTTVPSSSTSHWTTTFKSTGTSQNNYSLESTTPEWTIVPVSTETLQNYSTYETSFSAEHSTSSVDECEIKKDFNFKCIQKGRFKKLNDLSCTKYFLCSLLRNGSFIQTEYTCPDGSYFDKSREGCNVNYQCPCTTIPSSLTPHWTTISESIATDFPKSTTRNWTSNSVTSNPCKTDKSINFTCTKKGRFIKPNDLNCTQYYLCSLLKNGSFIQTEYSCPKNSYFDSNLQYCNVDYQCPCSGTLTTTPTSSSTEDPCRTPINANNFQCVKRGRFPNYLDNSCSTYYLCSKLLNGSFILTKYNCPNGTFFDPRQLSCSLDLHNNCLCNN